LDRTKTIYDAIENKMSASSYLLANKLDDSFFMGSKGKRHKRQVVAGFIKRLKDTNKLEEINGRWYKI